MATIKGTIGNNKLTGGSAADSLWGLAGNDWLLGLGGNDLLLGDTGNDTLDGGTGNDTMRGGAGNDTYFINSSGDKIDEQSNNDSSDKVRSTISVNLTTLGAGKIEHATLLGTANINATGNTSNNSLTGNTGNNSLSGGDGNDTLDGGAGNDKLSGGNGNDRMVGNAGNDSMTGGGGDDRMAGGAGNDTITGGAGNDRIDPGAGTNIINHSGTGSDGDDVLIQFGGGNNTVVFTGKDFYDFNFDRDGSDLIIGAAADENYEWDGTIRVAGFFYSDNNLTMKIDTDFNLYYGTNADIATIHFTADVTKGINNVNDSEILIGYYYSNDVINGNGGFYDALYGLDGDDTLNGGAGFDNIRGGWGDDELNGGTGDDILRGDSGTDSYDGGDGLDELYFLYGDAEDHGAIVDLSQNKVFDDGFGNEESVINVEGIRGSAEDDNFTGDANDNWFRGENGNDTLVGGVGNDTLEGGEGNDLVDASASDSAVLFGDTGDDVLIGSNGGDWIDAYTGKDTLTGNGGQDSFIMTNEASVVDIVTDYVIDDQAGSEYDYLSFQEDFFETAPDAGDLGDFVLFNANGGDLEVLFDADGTGGGSSEVVALLEGVASATGVVVDVLGSAAYRFNGTDFDLLS